MNSVEHAHDPLGALGILEVHQGHLELAVVDRGIGVRASLEIDRPAFPGDIDALLAVLGLNRRDVGTIGLPVLRRLVSRADLSLALRSGHGEVRVDGPRYEIDEWGHLIGGTCGVLRRPLSKETGGAT